MTDDDDYYEDSGDSSTYRRRDSHDCDDREDLEWLVTPENLAARQWLGRLEELDRVDIKDLTFKRRDATWDGPLTGIAEYKGVDHYFVAIFDEEGPGLSINVGRCYLLLTLPEELKTEMKEHETIDDYELDFENPLGYFGGSLGYFMTKTEILK